MAIEDIRSKRARLLRIMIMVIAQLICVLAVLIVIRFKLSRLRIPAKSKAHRKRVRNELMKRTDCSDRCRDVVVCKRRRMGEADARIIDIANSIKGMAAAVKECNTEVAKQKHNDTAEGALFSELEEIGVGPTLFPEVYMYLIQHPHAMRAFKGVPINRRKEMLTFIVPSYKPSS